MKDEIKLEIATPKGLFTDTFAKTAKVEDVIRTVIEEQDLDGGDSFDLVYNGEILQPIQRTLVSFGLEGTVKVELVATGSGV